MAPKNELTDEQKNDAEMKLLQGTCAICESVSLSAIKREKNLFRDADLILGYINQGDDMTAHPHSEQSSDSVAELWKGGSQAGQSPEQSRVL